MTSTGTEAQLSVVRACQNCKHWQQTRAQKRFGLGECYAGMPLVCSRHTGESDAFCPKTVLTEAKYVCDVWEASQ